MSSRYRYRRPEFTPSRHNHVGHMQFMDDFACCTSCEQTWKLTEKGWKPLPPLPPDQNGYDVYS